MPKRPNIVLFMTDDHAAPAIGAYGGFLADVAPTPAVDRLAAEGARFTNTFCTNAICSPARGTLLTGTYSHINGMTTLAERGTGQFDATQPSFPELLREAGYQTAIVGKWHLGHGGASDPHGFDHWEVLPHHGVYHDPTFLTADGETHYEGYVTDVITDLAIERIDKRDPDRPFCLLVQHKAPHRSWEPAERHAELFDDVEIPEPPTLHDDLENRSEAARGARMKLSDLTATDLKVPVPEGLSAREETEWRFQRYLKDYLRVVAALDEGVARVLDRLDEEGLADDTVVVYTSDHGFFLGEHGWFDKRFMYEESLRIPLVVRWPGVVPAGSVRDDLVANIDYAPTILDVAGLDAHPRMQGDSLLPLLRGGSDAAEGWRDAVYYRYWEHLDGAHRAPANYGVRTATHKLIHYPGVGLGHPGASDEVVEPEWELFDLVDDPHELRNRYDDPAYAGVVAELKERLTQLQERFADVPVHTS